MNDTKPEMPPFSGLQPKVAVAGRVLIALAAVGLVLALAWLPGRMVLNQSLALEAHALDLDVNRVVHGVRSEIQNVEDLAPDWAIWDDAYRFIQDKNQTFIDANLGWDTLLQSTRVNLISFLDHRGNMVWGGFRRTPTGPQLPMPPSLTGRAYPPSRSGIILTAEGPLMVAMCPITRSDSTGPLRGTLFLGRLLDETALKRVIRRVGISFQTSDTLRMSLTETEQLQIERLRAGNYDVAYGPKLATIRTFLPEVSGSGGLLITVPWPRDIYLQGRHAAYTISLTIFLAITAIAAILFIAFRRYNRLKGTIQEDLRRQVAIRTAELNEANKALEEASMVDALTGLKNRRFVDFTLPQDIARATRVHRSRINPPMDPSGVGDDIIFLVVDIDHFKMVNDTYGHAAGDAVLHQVGELLRHTCRESDLVARWGGEEFLLAAKRTHRAYAPVIAEKLIESFRHHTFTLPNGVTLQKTCSIGYCPFPILPERPQTVAWAQTVEIADLCLYAAKRNGRNGWVGVTPPENADLDLLARRLPSEFLRLVKEGLLEVRSSFKDARRIEWF